MRNTKRHIQRHCVASNVKPHGLSLPFLLYLLFSHSLTLLLTLSRITQARITHGTRLGNECDKHVSVTGPPAVGLVWRPSSGSLMPLLPAHPNFYTNRHRNHVFSGVLSFKSVYSPTPEEEKVWTVLTFLVIRTRALFSVG